MPFPRQDLPPVLQTGNSSAGEQERGSFGQDRYTASFDRGVESKISKPLVSHRILTDSWALKVLCWLLALLYFAVIMIVLGIFNCQSLQGWLSGLMLNTTDQRRFSNRPNGHFRASSVFYLSAEMEMVWGK